jgi:hypothetical protein
MRWFKETGRFPVTAEVAAAGAAAEVVVVGCLVHSNGRRECLTAVVPTRVGSTAEVDRGT